VTLGLVRQAAGANLERPRGPHPGQVDPDESIEAVPARSARGLPSLDGLLVPERKELEGQRRPRADGRPKRGEQRDHREPAADSIAIARRYRINVFRVFGGDRPRVFWMDMQARPEQDALHPSAKGSVSDAIPPEAT
jgi:hypothetical protein